MEEYYTIGQAAQALSVSTETLRRWDKNGKFRSMRHPMNNYRVYQRSKVDALLREMQETPESETPSTALFDPYFETDLGKLYQTDAIAFMQSLDPGSVHLIFADPPYNIKKAEWDSFSSQKAYVEWSMTWIREAERVLHPDGSLYICGFSEILADVKWAASSLFKGCKWLVWFYRNKANLGKDWGRSHESILHFRKSRDFLFNIDEARIPYNQHTLRYPQRTQAESSQYASANKKKDYVWNPHPKGAKPKDVLEIPTLSNGSWEKMEHPTQKPVELLRKVILSSSHPGSIVLDPFGGSGTTYAVAEAYNRRWLGTELEDDYCALIKQRVMDEEHIERILEAKDEKDAVDRRAKLRG